MARNQKISRKAERMLDELAEIAGKIDPDRFEGLTKKRERFEFRLSAVTKGEMEAAAEALGISVAAYLEKLHESAYPEIMKKLKRRRRRSG